MSDPRWKCRGCGRLFDREERARGNVHLSDSAGNYCGGRLRAAFAYDVAQHDGEWRVVRVDEGEPGYCVTGEPAVSQEAALAQAAVLNRGNDLSPGTVLALLRDVRRLEDARDAKEHRP